ncbi:acyl carrier protein [Paenibacillus oenotherae]|uniref:Acyl carrier protein n=1 Tax=Paenibacillus oenotherae TaxID=1435645 RepID=A0ABS7D962_9BACL|nr:phosphopantetheine-binding protein [Paenibacillus oenotherae]MBW7476497.1 acyl carrier protein [Paenibacillus oenotherae]
MTRTEIYSKLMEIIAQNFEIKLPDHVDEGSRIYEDLFIDSIMVLQLTVYIEEEFGIFVPEDNVDPEVLETVGSLISFIEHLKLQNQTA